MKRMQIGIKNIKAYLGDDYFTRLKVPVHLVDNFLQFVYTSDNLKIYLDVANYEGCKSLYRKIFTYLSKRLHQLSPSRSFKLNNDRAIPSS